MKRNDYDVDLLKYTVITCCALHNLCENQGEEYYKGWDATVTAEPGKTMPQATDDKGGVY